MQKIHLSPYKEGIYALVDDDDFEYISKWKWKYSLGYAVRSVYDSKNKKFKCLYMHRVVNKTPDGMITDHINWNKLDNRKSNLRTTDKSVNSVNRALRSDNTSGAVGVYKYHPKTWKDKGWGVRYRFVVQRKGAKTHYSGLYKTKEEAALARRKYLANL